MDYDDSDDDLDLDLDPYLDLDTEERWEEVEEFMLIERGRAGTLIEAAKTSKAHKSKNKKYNQEELNLKMRSYISLLEHLFAVYDMKKRNILERSSARAARKIVLSFRKRYPNIAFYLDHVQPNVPFTGKDPLLHDEVHEATYPGIVVRESDFVGKPSLDEFRQVVDSKKNDQALKGSKKKKKKVKGGKAKNQEVALDEENPPTKKKGKGTKKKVKAKK